MADAVGEKTMVFIALRGGGGVMPGYLYVYP
jgi:hypothetical protein